MPTYYIDHVDVCRLLTDACKAAGGQKKWADAHGISSTYVSNVLHSRCEPGRAMLEALGIVRVVMYRKREETAQ
jgi:hypothetical protein